MGNRFIPSLLLFGLFIACFAFMARYLPVNWMVQILIIGFVGISLALLLRLFDFKTIRSLYTEEGVN